METTSLKHTLRDWADIDSASWAIAIALGLMTEETNYQVDAKYVFWSNNPVGNMLHDILMTLVRQGILECRTTEVDDEYRWNPAFKGRWENGMVNIEYREFWDLPRLFIIHLDCDIVLFDCRFDESLDEYPDSYKVYAISREVDVKDNWSRISEEGLLWGEVKVADVKFDETKRQEMDLDFWRLLKWERPKV